MCSPSSPYPAHTLALKAAGRGCSVGPSDGSCEGWHLASFPPLTVSARPQRPCFSQCGQQQPGEPSSHLGCIHWRAPGFLPRLQPPGTDFPVQPCAHCGLALLFGRQLKLCRPVSSLLLPLGRIDSGSLSLLLPGWFPTLLWLQPDCACLFHIQAW